MMRKTETNNQKKGNISINNKPSSPVQCEKQIPRSSNPSDVDRKSQGKLLVSSTDSKT